MLQGIMVFTHEKKMFSTLWTQIKVCGNKAKKKREL